MPTPDVLDLVVLAKTAVADGVVRLTLGRDDDPVDLPEWEPGAHIDLHLGSDPVLVRQYSLCSSPTDRARYEVAILREAGGRGGSTFVADRLGIGDIVPVSVPRNHFALVPASTYRFVAGGIGITPMLPMIEAAERDGADWTLLYGGRTRASMAFADDLVATWGSRVSIRPQDECGLLDLEGALAEPDPATAVYCCGPEQLIAAVEAACDAWPPGTLHVERFTPAREAGSHGPDAPFEVEFALSGVTLTVAADQSIMGAAEAAGVDLMYSCEEGTCGVCEIAVLCGTPDHRDSVLTAQEREAGASLMVCVSRARSSRLVLDA